MDNFTLMEGTEQSNRYVLVDGQVNVTYHKYKATH